MMLEMKRVVLLLSVVFLTCAAPLHQTDVSSTSQMSRAGSQVTRVNGTPGSDIMIRVPAGFGIGDLKGRIRFTVSLRDENSDVSVLSFIVSLMTDQRSGVDGGDGETSEETFHHADAVRNSDDETADVGEDQSDDTSLDSNAAHRNTFHTRPSSEEQDTNPPDPGSDLQKAKVHPDQSDSTDLHHLHGHLTDLRSGLAFPLVHEETASAESDSRSDISSVEHQTGLTRSTAVFGLFHTALTSSSETELDAERERNVTDATRINSAFQSVLKESDVPPFSGSHLSPEYVNDEWQYDPRYYDPYRNHPAYAGYDPYQAGYDPYGTGYDPYQAGYDPYQAGYDPYQAGYDPYQAGYDPYQAGYDPYGENYDPYRAGYDPYGPGNDPDGEGYDPQEAYHERKGEGHDVAPDSTPAHSVEESESRPTDTSNKQDDSQGQERPQTTFVSPSGTPGSLADVSENSRRSEELTNSSSAETGTPTSDVPKRLPDPGSEGGEEKKGTGSSSSEESTETSEQENQDPTNPPGEQGTSAPAGQTSSHDHNVYAGEEPHPSPADLSSEEHDPLTNTIEHIMALGFPRRSDDAEKNPRSTPSDNSVSANIHNAEPLPDESVTEVPGISAEVTRDQETTPEPSDFTTTANDSEESEESPRTTASSIRNRPGPVHNSEEENRKSDWRKNNPFPARILTGDLWTSFLRALNVPAANQIAPSARGNVRRPQSSKRHRPRDHRRAEPAEPAEPDSSEETQ